MTLYQRHSSDFIGFLAGCFLLACAAYRSEWFFHHASWMIWGYHFSIAVGLPLVFIFGFRILGFKSRHGFIVLSVLEVILAVTIQWAVSYQPSFLLEQHIQSKIYMRFTNVLQYDPQLSQFEPKLGYRYRPNVVANYHQWEFETKDFRTNAAGLRDDNASLQHPKIISLGDSYTTGWGIEQEETYSQLLEKQTQKKVLNAGISSFGTIREGLLLQQLDRDSCQWVIIQYCLNDLEENLTWADSLLDRTPFKPRMDSTIYHQRVYQNQAQVVYSPFRYLFEVTKVLLHEYLGFEDRHYIDYNLKTMPLHISAFLKSIRYIQQFYNGNILIISLSNNRKLDAIFMEQIRQKATLMKLKNLHFLDATQYISPKDHYVIDYHLKPIGHQKVATQIAKIMEAHP
jgi:hypothetical protein